MEITEVKVFPVRDKKLRAFASIVFDGVFMINDIKVIHGRDGYFISMPSRRKKNGRFKDIAHPLNQETRQWLEERIISEYRRVAEGAEAPAAAAPHPAEAEPATGSGPRQTPEASRAVAAATVAEAAGAEVAAADEAGEDGEPAVAAASRPSEQEPAASEPPAERAVLAEEAAADGEQSEDDDEEERSEAADKSLDEIAEAHLSDSYWTT